MSDWSEFCELFEIDPNDPDQFDEVLDSFSKESQTRLEKFKDKLRYFAIPNCERCSGTGYIALYNHVEVGRCFACLPDHRWKELNIQ